MVHPCSRKLTSSTSVSIPKHRHHLLHSQAANFLNTPRIYTTGMLACPCKGVVPPLYKFVVLPTLCRSFFPNRLVDNGVPQGGVLSVALFALMINDIANSIPLSIGQSLFVDDFAIWCVSRSTPAMERQLQLAVTRLERWATLNGFRFSTAKTKAMHFCRSRGNCVGVPLRLYGAAIPLECSVRFLGLTMDSRLTYKEHFKLLN